MEPTIQAIFAATGSFFVIAMILASLLYLCQVHSQRSRNESSLSPTRAPILTQPKLNTAASYPRVSSTSIDESATFDPNLNRVSMQELVDATRNFSPDLIIGDGSFGLVYKARLNSGAVVAVKKLSPDAFQGLREFRAEMETLGNLKHHNIVKILGYCATGSDRVLIYEFIEKGSLDQWLYDTSSEEDYSGGNDKLMLLSLSWHNRLKIIRGVAMGLEFMHNLETPIIHRDIKASNILLDANFEAHIADFGLARRIEGSHSHVSTQVAGTMGYMPPEYLDGFPVATMTGDVYSFGVLMLEIVTGRRPSFPFPGEDKREVRLMEWVNKMVEQKRYMEMVDASIFKDDVNENMVAEVFKIGVRCADVKWKVRPTMKQVVVELDEILSRHKVDVDC